MDRIQKVSGYFLMILKALAFLIPAFIIFHWVFIGTAINDHPLFQAISLDDNFIGPEGPILLHSIAWTAITRTVGIVADMIGSLPIFISLFALMSIFKHYQKGEIFSVVNAKSYRLLGWLFFFDAFLAQPIRQAIMSIAVSFSNPAGQRYITISFGTPNMEALFCGAVLIMISWVMIEAAKMHEEQRLTI